VLDMGEGPDACLYICDMYYVFSGYHEESSARAS
jgi:hypothetical protein